LAAFGGIVMVVVVGAVLSQPSGPLARLGAYSFQIYLLSWFPQIGTRILLGQILHANIWLNVVMCIVSGLVIPIGVIRALNVMVPQRYRFTYGL
jgi:peptidoglycan/LPS O-acetylase OafA/YrhL